VPCLSLAKVSRLQAISVWLALGDSQCDIVSAVQRSGGLATSAQSPGCGVVAVRGKIVPRRIDWLEHRPVLTWANMRMR
jgi:hypothetical protein